MYLNRDMAYKILGLDPCITVTPKEIKKAYKKKALDVHPDKLVSSNLEDNDEFLKVSAAYEFLMKNNEGNFFTEDNGKDGTDTMNYIIVLCKFCHAFRKLFNNVVTNYHQYESFLKKNSNMNDEMEDEFFDTNENMNQEMYDIHVTIDVTLNELYNECGKKIKVKYNDENDERKTHVLIIPFVDYQKRRCYKMKGDWNKYNESYGDLYVHLNICESNRYVINDCIDKHDLVYSYDISVYDYYNGFKFVFNHFGENIDISHQPFESMEIIIHDKGLQGKNKRGDLYVIFNVNMNIHNNDMCFNELKRYFPSVF